MKRDNYYNKYHETFIGHINHTIWGISYDFKIQLVSNDKRYIINPFQQKVHHKWLVSDFLVYEREIDFHAYSGHSKHNKINRYMCHVNLWSMLSAMVMMVKYLGEKNMLVKIVCLWRYQHTISPTYFSHFSPVCYIQVSRQYTFFTNIRIASVKWPFPSVKSHLWNLVSFAKAQFPYAQNRNSESYLKLENFFF